MSVPHSQILYITISKENTVQNQMLWKFQEIISNSGAKSFENIVWLRLLDIRIKKKSTLLCKTIYARFVHLHKYKFKRDNYICREWWVRGLFSVELLCESNKYEFFKGSESPVPFHSRTKKSENGFGWKSLFKLELHTRRTWSDIIVNVWYLSYFQNMPELK